MTSAMFMSAFGTDFGLAEYPSFVESAKFRLCYVMHPPAGITTLPIVGISGGQNGDITLAWFATHTGNPVYFEKERFLRPAADMGKLSRIAGPGLVWLSQFEARSPADPPMAWMGKGANPIVIFKDAENGYYFGGKGGRGTVNHGNMDGGSFIFELDGVRWVVDPGNQSYHALEKTGFNLWGRCQNCERWTLITKNNYGHSTLTYNNMLHKTDGLATIANFKDGPKPEATIDMSATFGGTQNQVMRRFVKPNNHSLLIEDSFEIVDSIKVITWQLMTTADVELVKGGAILHQDGKKLNMKIQSHPDMSVSVISLDPPPLELDRKIDGLKRIEVRLPAYLFEEKKKAGIKVLLERG